MLTANGEEGSLGIMDELFSVDDQGDDVLLDLDSFWRVMGGEPTEPLQESMLENLPSIDVLQGSPNVKDVLSPRSELPGCGILSPSHNSEASDCRTGCSDSFSESAGTSFGADVERLEPSSQFSFAEHSYSRSVGDGLPFAHAVGGSRIPSFYCQSDSWKVPFETPTQSDMMSSYSADPVNHDGESSEVCHMNYEEDLFGSSGAAPSGSENLYQKKSMEDIPHLLSQNGDLYLLNSDDPPYFPHSVGFQSLAGSGRMVNTLDESKNPDEDFNSMTPHGDLIGNESHHIDGQVGVAKYNDMNAMRNVFFSKRQDGIKFKKNNESITSNKIVRRASDVIDDVFSKKYNGGAGMLPATEGIQWSTANSLPPISSKNCVARIKDENEDRLIKLERTLLSSSMVGERPVKVSAIGAHGCHSGILPPRSVKAEINSAEMENEVPKYKKYCTSNIPYRGIQSRPVKAEINSLKMENEVSEYKSYCTSNIPYPGVQSDVLELSDLDDEPDVFILEDMSAPARPNPALNGKLVGASPFLASRDPMGHSRIKANDEQVIFRVAVQDLSQPKSEATPPDGLLAVPLLKHQRIALSWMVNKETRSACCSGGILADDQGLGKTVSTIALILKERSPSSKAPKANKEQSEAHMLSLDEDDEESLSYHVKEPREDNGGKGCLQSKGRPAGGTLIVCPTSVLRQWNEELHTKVTSEANISVLVYHGGNRTKDPLELAKYDVVITTYAIVSMEVPKQPVVDEKDDPIGTPYKGFSSSKKRKLHANTNGKTPCTSKKSKKGIDNELLESISGPLAKVGWFRVVLDEAQSIKNHRTQVARACWGLRAKRRWCLSGTPIQNAIDDLYSYFRFLRHEPYAIFKTFCEQIKAPIHRNPKDGYKKLQAVLKTIMLRRTKGTFIDGEPIINLPPKTIELKRVDFSMEERDFYCRLEADSRAQFAEYAAAGTVKQNYVNILLMLLRLRQACDHPLLVKGLNSNSQMASSIAIAKKLPREKHMSLLNCLEASLAICGICNDPPEDAVVTVCGHVFCNQCICEQLIGDDTQCPTKSCKTHITMSHVFSISTLRIAISDQQTAQNTPICSGSELALVSKSPSINCPQGSSKIRAALQLLLNLSKPQDPALLTGPIESIEGCHSSETSHGCGSNSIVKFVGEKAIVFSQWTRMLDLLEACLKDSSVQYRRLDGTMPVIARDRAVKDFNSLPQVTVMIMSLKAASLGLNMVAACHVILLDLWWNPTTEDQAIDRAHRIGQTRPVSVFRLTVKDTVEDRILALQQKKREMVASAFGEDGTGGTQTRLTVEDLKYLFRAD
ncbi:hypothetical protein ACP275_13G157400 [Erythranthe tilingii]